MLHIGTHYYLVWMQKIDAMMESTDQVSPTTDSEVLSSKLGEGALHDVLADALGYTEINLRYLDFLCFLIPTAWLIGTVYTRNLGLWVKCMLCACFLALGKGILCWATVIPDSIGWSNCKHRLGRDGVELYLNGFHFQDDPITSLLKMFRVDVFGSWEEKSQRYMHYRFCADMMYSGHTFVTALFSLGLYELIRTWLFPVHRREGDSGGWRDNKIFIHVCYALTSLLLLSIVALELILVVRNRFHYTMDIFVSLTLVLLYFTNAWIVIMCEMWEHLLTKPEPNARIRRGEVVIPICCVPFTFVRAIRGRWFLYERKPEFKYFHPREEGSSIYVYQELEAHNAPGLKKQHTIYELESDGEEEEDQGYSTRLID